MKTYRTGSYAFHLSYFVLFCNMCTDQFGPSGNTLYLIRNVTGAYCETGTFSEQNLEFLKAETDGMYKTITIF
jgi:hypothetical protein